MNVLIKKRKMKNILIIFCAVIIAPLIYFGIWTAYYEPYPYCTEKIDLTYLGSATGACPYFKDENGLVDPKKWKEKNLYIAGVKVMCVLRKKIT